MAPLSPVLVLPIPATAARRHTTTPHPGTFKAPGGKHSPGKRTQLATKKIPSSAFNVSRNSGAEAGTVVPDHTGWPADDIASLISRSGDQHVVPRARATLVNLSRSNWRCIDLARVARFSARKIFRIYCRVLTASPPMSNSHRGHRGSGDHRPNWRCYSPALTWKDCSSAQRQAVS